MPRSHTVMRSPSDELVELDERAAPSEGDTESAFPGMRFLRVSKPSSFRRWHAFGPMLTVVAQGRKTSTYRGVHLAYDPHRFLVVTGEAEFEGKVIEASPERPFLAFCYAISPDVVARTLLTLADASVDPVAESVPAFVGPLDTSMLDCAVRWLRALEDPLERRVVAPLVVEELVFRLLRSDAAAVVRCAVGKGQDTDKIEMAMRFLQANVERPVSVEDVARVTSR